MGQKGKGEKGREEGKGGLREIEKRKKIRNRKM